MLSSMGYQVNAQNAELLFWCHIYLIYKKGIETDCSN
jgi:hypothetical protein